MQSSFFFHAEFACREFVIQGRYQGVAAKPSRVCEGDSTEISGCAIVEIQGINPENFNLLVMSLDELFASVARKIGPRLVRELAAQEANKTLINFDFAKIVDWLKQENFVIPPTFRLAAQEIGTGVKEICELLMIIESGKISSPLNGVSCTSWIRMPGR